MAEPARKFPEIEPDIRPHFDVVSGGGESTPERASLSALKKQESKPEIPGAGSIAEQESKGSNVVQGPWKNKVAGSAASKITPVGRLNTLKKKGPLTAIILTLAGGVIGIGALLTPSLLIVQFKEIMVNKFNTQLASMDVRTTKMLTKKVGTLNGLCTGAIDVRCRYATMSKKQIEKFEKAGIKVHYDDKNLFGRAKPTSFEFEGRKIKPSEFNNMVKSSSAFRTAVKKAYNPLFAGFADAIWNKAAAKLGISKTKAKIDGETDEERLKSIQEDTKNPMQDGTEKPHVQSGDEKPGGGVYDDSTEAGRNEIKAANAAIDSENRVLREMGEAAGETASNAAKTAPGVIAGAASSIANTVKITGWVDNACTAYNAVRAVGFAAKTVRALQLARYAMIFLNVADQIKAGTAKSEDVAYLGKILTTEVAATATSMKLGSATSSFGYRFAAYGERGTMSDTASQFLAGGGLAGKLIGVTSLIDKTIKDATGASPRKACKVLGNPFVSAGSAIIGVALFFVPGVNVAVGALDIAKAAAGVGIQVAIAYLPALLQDIVAGVLVDKTTVGEAAGEAITSGASGVMGTTANTGGNAPLTPDQAVAYGNLSNQIAAQYAEDDRLAYSPFDATNGNTFMGKIVGQLIPYASSMTSFSSTLGSIASMITGSFASLTPQSAYAASTADYTMCQDYDYKDMNLATDPYCNVTYGIPTQYLNEDPIKVVDALNADKNNPQVDETTGDPVSGSNYEKFVKNCIDRTWPLGDDSDGKDFGDKCLFGEKYNGTPNNNYYIHYIDQRVQMGLDGDDIATQGTSTPEIDPSGFDNSNQSCSDGTKDLGVVKTKYSGSLVQTKYPTIRLCQLSSIIGVGANKSGAIISGGAIVNAAVSGAFQQLGEKALSQNPKVQLTAGSSFRLFDSCGGNGNGSSCASPGASPHQLGIAIDFGLSDGHLGTSTTSCSARATSRDPQWKFLHKYAASFGIKQYTYENWHWDASGMSNRCA